MIYFVRHGESQANVQQVFAGQSNDSPLTNNGREQAQAAAKDLESKHIVINRIISSPLQRAHQTAIIIADALGFDQKKIQIDARVAEYDMGSLTGQPIHPMIGGELAQTSGAERPKDFLERVTECIAEAKQQLGNTLIVSHAGVGRILEANHQGLSPEDFHDKVEAYMHGHVVELEA